MESRAMHSGFHIFFLFKCRNKCYFGVIAALFSNKDCAEFTVLKYG